MAWFAWDEADAVADEALVGALRSARRLIATGYLHGPGGHPRRAMAEPYDTLLQVQEHDTDSRPAAPPDRGHARAGRPGRGACRQRCSGGVAIAEVQAQVDELAGRQAALEERIAASAKRRHDLEERMRSGVGDRLRRTSRPWTTRSASWPTASGRSRTRSWSSWRRRSRSTWHWPTYRRQRPSWRPRQPACPRRRPRPRSSFSAAIVDRGRRPGPRRAAGLPADLAERYERLRSHLGGVGAARLVGDRCDGCHLTLPSVEVERIHHLSADTFATCPQCDRILVH